MWYSLFFLISTALAQESDCPCLLSCPNLFIDCPAGSTNPPAPNYCNQSTILCPTDSQDKAALWTLQQQDACQCPVGYTGFQCELNTPELCNMSGSSNHIFDGGFLNYAVEKKMECTVDYDPSSVVSSVITFIQHRIDISISAAPNTGDLTVTGRFVLYSRLQTTQDFNGTWQCGTMTKVLQCDIGNCVGAVRVGDPKNQLQYECSKADCTPCNVGSSCNVWQGLTGYTNGKPFVFYFGNQNTTSATATGALKVDLGGATFELPLHCRAGQCVNQIVQALYYPPSQKNAAVAAAGAVVGILTVLALIFGAYFIHSGRRVSRKLDAEVPLLLEREISKEVPSTVAEDGGINLTLGSVVPMENIEQPVYTGRKSSQPVEESESEGKQSESPTFEDEEMPPTSPPSGIIRQGSGLVFQDLEYTIRLPNGESRTVIKKLSGIIQPGEFVAIIGPSGAGKSTLLNALAGYEHRLAGRLDGKINFYGNARGNRREVVSFVLQEDTLIPTDTVREALLFSARLRSAPHVSETQIQKTVGEVMKELGLEEIADSMIGDPSIGGISGGERRRVQIGVELVTKPGLLLLDEPTSGLDSFKVGSLLTLLQKISRNTSPCLLSIHQMSARHFRLFDRIIVVTKQGELGFFGSPTQALSFLKSINLPLPKNENPADHLLLLATQPKTSQQIATSYAASMFGQGLNENLALAQSTRQGLIDSKDSEKTVSRPSRSRHYQFRLLLWRSLKYVARAPTTVYTTLFLAFIMSFILGIVFYKVDNGIPGTQNRAGVLFFMVIYWSLTALTALGMFIVHRAVFEKELAAGYYCSDTYFWAQVTSDFLSLRLLQPLSFGLICYFMIGLQAVWDKFLLFLFVLVLIHVVASTWCMLVSTSTSTIAQAEICAVILLVFAMVFGGNFLNNTTDNPLLNLRWISFVQYAYEAMFVNEFHGLNLILNPVGLPTTQITGDVIILNFGMDYARRSLDVGILVVWGVVFLLAAFFVLLWKSRLPRIARGPLDR